MTDHDDTKISPSAMKAVWQIIEAAVENHKGLCPSNEELAEIIEQTTNLSLKEAAMRELVAAEENVIANLLTKETLMSKEALQRWTDANDRKTAALANAKALEVK